MPDLKKEDFSMFYENIPEILYHYCSISSFFSIIRNKSLWMCNGLNMNDKYDSRYLELVAYEWLEVIEKQTNDIEKKKFCNMCSEILLNYHIERPVPYITSFSDNGDLLSQWRAYANQGTGVCIGFETMKLFEYAVDNPSHFLFPFSPINKDDIILINVEYSKERIENTIEKLFEMFFNIYLESEKNITKLEEIAILFCGSIYKDSVLYKHSGFHEECEWRFISHRMSHFSNTQVVEKTDTDIEFECINGNIKSHFTLDLQKNWDDGLIRNIILGPRFNGNEFDLRFFLAQNFPYEIDIKKSMIPYTG